jgi:hypothetical protein
MKRIKSFIKLTSRNSERLNEKELNRVISGEAGCEGNCGCWYAQCGGSSSIDNENANAENLHSEIPWDEAEWFPEL